MDFLKPHQRILIALLTCAIRNEPPDFETGRDTDWRAVIDESIKHQVFTLIYKPLRELGEKASIPQELMENLKIHVAYEGMEQEKNYYLFADVLRCLAEKGIEAIVLKGLVLRELYPEPSLRTMCDFDLLVKPDNIASATSVLTDLGYEIKYNQQKHMVFGKENQPVIELHRHISELHRHISSKTAVDGRPEFEEHVWNRAEYVTVSGVHALSLCPAHQVIYTVIHMASHLFSGGFGLRQMTDFVLQIEAYREIIDWADFFEIAESLGIRTFTCAVFQLCHRLFNLDISRINPDGGFEYEVNQFFVSDILDGGVFGRREENGSVAANRIIYYNEGSKAIAFKDKLIFFFKFLFPGADKLDGRFGYAKEHRYLLPIAWIHRMVFNVLRKDISLTEKLAAITFTKPFKISNKRGEMLKQLGLLS